jgi:hypothetical protein
VKSRLAVLAVACLSALSSASPVRADRAWFVRSSPSSSGPARGYTCGLLAVDSPNRESADDHVGLVYGSMAASVSGASVTLRCTVQVGEPNSTHAGADAAQATNGPNLSSATVAESVEFLVPEGQPLYVCTEVEINGTRYYWDAGVPAWSLSNGADCFF